MIGNHLSYGATAWFPPFETLMRLAASEECRSAPAMLWLPLYERRCTFASRLPCSMPPVRPRHSWRSRRAGSRTSFAIMGIDHARRIGRYNEAVALIKRLVSRRERDFGAAFPHRGLTLAMRPTGTTPAAVARRKVSGAP